MLNTAKTVKIAKILDPDSDQTINTINSYYLYDKLYVWNVSHHTSSLINISLIGYFNCEV